MTSETFFHKLLPRTPGRARWAVVGLLAVATLGAHAVLTQAGPSASTPSMPDDPTRIDFLLPDPAPLTPPSPDAASTGMPPAQVSATNGPVTVRAGLDRDSVLVGGDGEVYAELVIEGATVEGEHRVPTDLVVVLDHSGSMSGIKIEQARSAALDLLDRLSPEDGFALIGFSSSARVLIPTSPATLDVRDRWRRQIRSLGAGGGTDMLEALGQTVDLLERRRGNDRPCRVLLLSDGRPDTAEGLDALARRASRLGAALSSLGIGADFNEVLMGRLADLGTGNYYYLDRPEALAAVFAGELDAGRTTVARGLEIHLRPHEGVTLADAAGYPLERRADGSVIVRPGDLFSGQTRRLWLSLNVRADEAFEARPLGDLEVTFFADGQTRSAKPSTALHIASVEDPRRFEAGIDGETWGRAVIQEEYGELQSQVADLVRTGKKKEAQKRIEGYVTKQSRRNATVQNSAVSDNLAEVEELREEVEQVFEGPRQAEKMKVLSKERHKLSQEMRRIGSAPKKGGGS